MWMDDTSSCSCLLTTIIFRAAEVVVVVVVVVTLIRSRTVVTERAHHQGVTVITTTTTQIRLTAHHSSLPFPPTHCLLLCFCCSLSSVPTSADGKRRSCIASQYPCVQGLEVKTRSSR